MPLFHLNRCNLKRRLGLNGHSLCALLVGVVYACGLAGCGDIPTAPPPDPGPLTIVTNSPLPSGTVNQPYASALGGSGGITPYTWSLASGSPALPAGRFLDSTTGTITGTPTAPGTTTPIFRLEDSSSPVQAVQKSLTITITTTPQPLTISTSSLPEGAVNQPYPPTILQATGEIQPYTWSVNPALPNGLQFNVLSPGTISGTPLNGMAGTTTHTFAVSDSDAPFTQRATTQLSLKINPLPLAVEGDLSLSVPVFDSKIILQTRAMFAGAVSSLIFRGKEHLDSHDHGRLLQSASSFDGYGECFNPTEGGASPESQSQNVSVLKAARVEGNQLWTVVDMGFWLNPGQAYPNGCGRRKSLTKAVNTVLTSGHLLEKRVTVLCTSQFCRWYV